VRSTKIICTLGPASGSLETIGRLACAGMDIARFNLSHGSHDEHHRKIVALAQVNAGRMAQVATVFDIQGPHIRLGVFAKDVMLTNGSIVTLTPKEISCSESLISVSYEKLSSAVRPGDPIYIADGMVELLVKAFQGEDVVCEVVEGGLVGTHKNLSIPSARLDLPALSEKDCSDIAFACREDADFIAQSFVRNADDVLSLRQLLRQLGSHADIIAKIETAEALENLDSIIDSADAVMIARGDLGVQMPIEDVPLIQKDIVRRCNTIGKPVIVATQMLESMTRRPRPTRAEAADIANAVLDGADALLLSGETAIGEYPLKAVETLHKVALAAETIQQPPRQYGDVTSIADAVSRSACETARSVGAKAIICWTISGKSAGLLSRYRPQATIIAASDRQDIMRRLTLWNSVQPMLIHAPQDTDALIASTVKSAIQHGMVRKGEVIVIVSGYPFSVSGDTNLVKVHTVQ
jgi:pyruvate kinase